ncbi:MAG TPA: divergent polysaccharide deacetylase family protein [Solimonas sp.]|nr:divergent polysaccharide deacetylase family protein [Solimonas sp.]
MRRRGRLALSMLLLALPRLVGAEQLPAIAIIIDDLGDRLGEGREAVELPGPVAMAFLPESHFTPRLAQAARSAGKEVLLHLPLEPLRGRAHPMTISHTETTAQRDAMLLRALAAVPFAQGVNNHQGSAMTERRDEMDWLMGRLAGHGQLYFVDSYTSPLSVAYAAARDSGLPATRRQVFLDDSRQPAAIRQQFRRLVQLARRSGSALAIGHPFRETLAVLREELPNLAAYGVRLAAPSELITLQQQRAAFRIAQIRLRLSMVLADPPPVPVPDESAAADTSAVSAN